MKAYLYHLLSEDSKLDTDEEDTHDLVEPVVPLQLRLLYESSDLDQARRFHIVASARSSNNEEEQFKRQTDILPRPKNAHPSHGTVVNQFVHGDPGLI